MKDGRLVATVGGLAAVVGGIWLLLRKPGEPPEPPPDYANLYGVVIDTTTGLPIGSVSVTATTYGGEEFSTSTNSSGQYTLANLPLDYVSVVFSKDGYEDESHSLMLVEGNNELNTTMSPVVEPPPEPPPGEFSYDSALVVTRSDYPTVGDLMWEVRIKNIGDTEAELYLEISSRDFEPPPCAPDCHMGRWIAVGSLRKIMIAGESTVFQGYVPASTRIQTQVMVECQAGKLLEPAYPPEDQSWY